MILPTWFILDCYGIKFAWWEITERALRVFADELKSIELRDRWA